MSEAKKTVRLPFSPEEVLAMKRKRDTLFEKYGIPIRLRESSIQSILERHEKDREVLERVHVWIHEDDADVRDILALIDARLEDPIPPDAQTQKDPRE